MDEPGEEPEPKPETPSLVVAGKPGDKLDLGKGGGSVDLSFTTNVDWEITVESSAKSVDWVSVNPSSGKAGKHIVKVSVEPNESYENRVATMTLRAGELAESFTISQSFKEVLSVSVGSVALDASSQEFELTVNSNVEYEVEVSESGRGWIRQAEGTRAVPTDKVLRFSVDRNESLEPRKGSVVFSDGKTSQTVEVTQEGAVPEIEFITMPPDRDLSGEGETFDIGFESPEDWVAEVETPDGGDWVSVTPASGKAGRSGVKVIVTENTKNERRTAKVVFRGKTVKAELGVSQEAAKIEFSVDKSVVSLDSNRAGEFWIGVTAGERWTVRSDCGWLHPDRTEGDGSGSVRVAYDSNQDSDRVGHVIFKCGEVAYTVTVKQIGAEIIERVLKLNPNRKELPAEGGTFSFELTCDTGWIIENMPGWLGTVMTEGPGMSAPQTVSVNCEPNEGKKRSASFKVSTRNGSKYEYFQVEQAGKEDTPSPGTGDGILKGHELNGTKWKVSTVTTIIETGMASGKDADGSYSYPVNENDTELDELTIMFEGDYIHIWSVFDGEEVYEKQKIENRKYTEDKELIKVTYSIPDMRSLVSGLFREWDYSDGTTILHKGDLKGTLTYRVENGRLMVDGFSTGDDDLHWRVTSGGQGNIWVLEHKETTHTEITLKGTGVPCQ